jgi:polyisoprenoid-binding protein YceI
VVLSIGLKVTFLIKKIKMRKIFLLITTLINNTAYCQSGTSFNSWFLPYTLNNHNTKINFVVDSTWHTVHGQADKITGKVWLKDIKYLNSIRASIEIPVNKLNTENTSRDRKMRKVMHSDKHRLIKVAIDKVIKLCSPQKLITSCKGLLGGNINISGVSKKIELPIIAKKDICGITISGKKSLNWDEFGVEDPSILVAYVDKSVKINFSIILNKTGKQC